MFLLGRGICWVLGIGLAVFARLRNWFSYMYISAGRRYQFGYIPSTLRELSVSVLTVRYVWAGLELAFP